MHRAKGTHIDLEPSNVLLDDGRNAVLIDISGVGGITHEWLALEIQDEIELFDLPFATRRLNDIWAYGRLLNEIASGVGNSSPFVGPLELVAQRLTRDVNTRWTLI